VSEEEFMK
jgi:hypothetical protein